MPRPAQHLATAALRRRLRDDERGVVAVELALVLPVLLALIFLVIDVGRVFNYAGDANQIAAEGARMAAVDTYDPAALRTHADTPELRNGTGQVTMGLRVCVSFPSGSSEVGDPVKVTTEARYAPLRFLAIAGDFDIKGSATMRLERKPSFGAGCSG